MILNSGDVGGKGKGPASETVHCKSRFSPMGGTVRRLDRDTKCFQLQQELLWAVLNEKSWTHVGSYNSDLLVCLSK